MTKSLDEQRAEFSRRRFLAMPLAGTVAWTLIGVASLFSTPFQIIWVTFIATGSIVYLGMAISRFTGEHFLNGRALSNEFDKLFLMTVAMSALVYSIAIPFFLIDISSLPLTVGILTGLMWLPLSWMIKHWIGIFHAIVRTTFIVIAWYLYPANRFTVIPLVIVAVYLFSIVVLERRFKRMKIEGMSGG